MRRTAQLRLIICFVHTYYDEDVNMPLLLLSAWSTAVLQCCVHAYFPSAVRVENKEIYGTAVLQLTSLYLQSILYSLCSSPPAP